MKKVSTFLCMVLCSIALHANVVTGTCGDSLTWSYDTDTKALTIEGSGAMADYDYCSSNQPWAQVSSDILSVSLPEGLTSIGSSAFERCSALTSINFSNSVTSIGRAAFYGCSSLNTIILPNSVASIEMEAFRECSSLTSIILPNSVKSIGSWAFLGCSSLTSIILPNSVTSIGEYMFYGCSSLTSVTIPNSVTSIGEYAFADCTFLTSIILPNSVTSIGGSAFSSCAQVIVECTTPPTIESGTFKSDASIFVPCSAFDTYLQTAVWQFLDLKGLSHTINLSATEGGKATITATDCDSTTATIEAIEDNLYQFSQWSDGNTDNPRTIILDKDTTLSAIFAFATSGICGDSLTWTYQNHTLQIDGTGEMYSYFLKDKPWKVWEDSINELVWNAKNTYGWSSIYVDVYPFYSISSQITSVVFGDNVETIPTGLCYSMEQLQSITIPINAKQIMSGTFDGCTSLKEIVWNAKNCSNSAGEDQHYLVFDGVATQIQTFTFGNQVEVIPYGLCANMTNLVSVTIPESVKKISGGVFENCYRISSIAYNAKNASNMTEDGQFYLIFNGANSNVKTFTIGENVETLPSYLCCDMSQLTSITIPENVREILGGVFEGCSKLSNVYWNAKKASNDAGDGYFYYIFNNLASQIKLFEIGENVETLPVAICENMINLKALTIPASIKSLDYHSFYNCSGLQHINAEAEKAPTIGYETFDGVPVNTPIYIPCGSKKSYTSKWSYFKNIVEPDPDYSIAVYSSDLNQGTANIDQPNTCSNDEAVISATSKKGYIFKEWGDGNTENPRSVMVTSNLTFIAYFEEVTAVDNIQLESQEAEKILINNHVYIQRNGHTYTIVGDCVDE